MKTVFTRKELIHTAIEEIRIYIRLYGKTDNLIMLEAAQKQARALETLHIIKLEKMILLEGIIERQAFAEPQINSRRTSA